MNYRAIQEMSIRIADDCIVQQAPPVLKRLPIKSQRPKSFPIERIKVRQVQSNMNKRGVRPWKTRRERERHFQKRQSEPKGMVWTEVYL